MPHRCGSKKYLIDNDSCESAKIDSNSPKHTSINLDDEDFDDAFENGILRITDDRKGCSIFERHKIISSLVLVVFTVASVIALIAIKYHGYTKSDNYVPSSGEWKGLAHLNTTEYPFQTQLDFLSNNTFTGLIYFGSTGFGDVQKGYTKISGHWSGHDITFQYGNYSGAGNLINSNKIHGRWSDGILEYNFELSKPSPIVIKL